MNRSVLCNCRIEAENNFSLEFLATCHDGNTKLVMYFTVNITFTNYINKFNLMEELEAPILTNKTLLYMPMTLKEFIDQYKHHSEISDLKEMHDID